MNTPLSSPRTFFLVYLALLALLALTFGMAFVNLGPLNTAVGLVIALVKAFLVLMVFMDLRQGVGHGVGMNRLTAAAGLFWLAIVLTLTLGDYFTRGLLELPGNWPPK